jgi:hypothetical protein
MLVTGLRARPKLIDVPYNFHDVPYTDCSISQKAVQTDYENEG